LKVLIATPAYGGVVTIDYHDAVLKTVLFFKDEFPGIRFETRYISISMLALARNIFASVILNDSSFTHLLFIDSDMGFRPELIARMIAFDKPVVGVVAPKRSFDFDALQVAAIRSGHPEKDRCQVRINGASYVGSESDFALIPAADGAVTCDIQEGFVTTRRAGAGILLIARGVFETMKERFPEEWIADPHPGIRAMGLPTGGLIQCFDAIKSEHGVYNGEDMSFCQRWVDMCGGEIWVNVDENVVHVGQERYLGRYIDKLRGMEADMKAEGPPPASASTPQPRNRHERRAMMRKAG
jgi:hypothetical protein